MGRLRVTVRSDGLAAELEAVPGPPVLAADVHAALAGSGVVHGIDAAAVDDVVARLADPARALTQVVARGEPPVPGTDGTIECAACGKPQVGAVQADGSIDFRERELLHPAAAGQVIARIVPPTPGTPGRSVRGATIATRAGKPMAQRLGPGVRAEADQVVAACGGVVLHSARQIDVVALYTHAANVDLESGNLHSSGSLLIRGDVCEGFLATADGDVQVTGAVLDARVTAGGSLRVDQGILGEACDVQAGENVGGRHATSARLHAGGTIELRDGATHCRMVADRIRILAGRGVAFGGELHARQSIELRVAGTPGGSPTHLSVCDLNEERTELVRREADAARLERSCARHGHGTKSVRQATRAADLSEQERLRMLQRQRELLRTATIRIDDTVFPGVVLQFGQHSLRVTEPLRATTFRYDLEQDTIVQCPLP